MPLRCRNDNVLIRIVQVGKTDSGVLLPEISVEGKLFCVEAVGPKVDDLKVGDKVIMVGEINVDYGYVPGMKDLLCIKQGNVVLVMEPEPVPVSEATCVNTGRLVPGCPCPKHVGVK